MLLDWLIFTRLWQLPKFYFAFFVSPFFRLLLGQNGKVKKNKPKRPTSFSMWIFLGGCIYTKKHMLRLFSYTWFYLILEGQLNGNGRNYLALWFKCWGRRRRWELRILPSGSQLPAVRCRNFQKEDVLTFQLLHSCALLMYQTADIIYKTSNGNNCSHFIISMSS